MSAEQRKKLADLERAHQAMVEVERLWDQVKEARPGNPDRAKVLERRMAERARRYLEGR